MTQLELRWRVHDAVIGALNDEGVMSADQAAAISKAVVAGIDMLVELGAIDVPHLTRSQEAELRRVDQQRNGTTVAEEASE